jgi:hypothetical protein
MTLISHKYKFVFLANPKCASTTLHEMLRPYSDEAYTFSVYQRPIGTHADAKTVKKYLKRKGRDIKDYYVITTIREPFARIKSCFRYESHWKHHKDITDLFRPIPKDFKSYVMGDWFFKRFIDIDKFTRDEDGKQLVDSIIKVEEFSEEVPKLIKKLQLPLNIDKVPMSNVTSKKKGVDYDKEMKEHIYNFHFGDFKFYPVEE